ncbi:MAG TPA: hypothetical protein ENJ95_21275 [Bacteroidetes bacterium]|nr:hypothetical protein [Bacteroidota bacterium]
MINEEKNINAAEVASTINQLLKELRDGLDPSALTSGERTEILKELEKTELAAYKAKLQPHLKKLTETLPEMPVRDAIIQLLAHVRPEASADMVALVTNYIFAELGRTKLKAAA